MRAWGLGTGHHWPIATSARMTRLSEMWDAPSPFKTKEVSSLVLQLHNSSMYTSHQNCDEQTQNRGCWKHVLYYATHSSRLRSTLTNTTNFRVIKGHQTQILTPRYAESPLLNDTRPLKTEVNTQLLNTQQTSKCNHRHAPWLRESSP
jgi:hypothetical protein